MAKEHGRAYFEPIGKALQREGIKNPSLVNPRHMWALRKEFGTYARWLAKEKFKGRDRQQVPGMDGRLAAHVDFALEQFRRQPAELSGAMSKHQLKLADRQCRIAELSQRVQDLVVMVVTALYAHQRKDEPTIAAADVLCQDLRRKLTGERPSDGYFRDVGKLADAILAGGFDVLTGIAREEILMRY